MSKFSVFVLLCTASCALAQNVNLPNGQTKKPFVPPVAAIIDERNKEIDADFPGGWQWSDKNGRRHGANSPDTANMKANSDNVNFRTGSGHDGVAGFQDGYVQALGPKNNVGSGNLFMDNGQLVGGLAQAGDKTANLRNTRVGNDDHKIDLQSGPHSAVATADNLNNAARPVFGANGQVPNSNKKIEGVLDVYNQQGRSGNGELMYSENGRRRNNITYNQQVIQGRGSQQDKVQIEFRSKDGRILNGNNWVCESAPTGTTQCKDENGKLVGKTVHTNPGSGLGETLVYDQNNRVVGRAKVRKVAERKYVAEINDGLMAVNVDEFTKYDCFDQANAKYGGPSTYKNSKIKVENMDVKYNTQELSGGKKKFMWPDCFKMSADVTLPPGIPSKCIAWEVVVHVLPMGTYDCTDAGTCPGLGRNCYYCDLCKKRDLEILANTAGNTCDGSTGGKKRIEETVCPTPEGEKLLMCQGFDRHLLGNDYYKYNGTLNAELRVWMRGDCLKEDQVRRQFDNANIIQRNLWAAEYKIDAAKAGENVIAQGFNLNADEVALFAWYKSKNAKDSLIGCQKAVVDYGLGKEGGSDVVLDQMAALGKKQTLFNDKACPQWTQQQKQEFKDSAPAQETNSNSGNPIGGLIGQLTGGGGSTNTGNSGGGGIFDRFRGGLGGLLGG